MGAIVAAGVFIVAITIAILSSKETEKAWKAAAHELRIHYEPAGFFSSREMAGVFDGHLLEIATTGGKNASTTFKVNASKIPPTLAVRPEGTWTNIQKVFTGEDVLLRDESFDAKVNIHGVDEEIVALMDEKTRGLVRQFVELGGTVEGGVVALRRAGVLKSRFELVQYASQAVMLAKRLSRGPTRQLLMENAISDPLAAVRVRNLEMLVSRHAKSEQLAQAAQAALSDSSPIVRMVGASSARGEAGRAVLEAIVLDPQVPEDVRVASLERLASVFPWEQVRPAMIEALEAREEALRIVAVAAIGHAHDLGLLDRLCAIASLEPSALAKALARTLGNLGDSRAEPTLLRLLGHDDVEVRTAAATALGLAGTVHAVEPLLPLTKGVLAGELHKAAQDAVRRIQSRLGDAGAGQISLAKVEDVAGAVSLASDGGELSLANKQDAPTVEGSAASQVKIPTS